MILLSYDLETTGLNVNEDEPIEVGLILYSTGQKRCLESAGFLVRTDKAISDEVTRLTGISAQAVKKFGYQSEDALDTVLEMMEQADAIVGQNVIRFDKRMTENWAGRHGKKLVDKLYIDTYTDLPTSVEPKSLRYMACDAGFIPSSSHSALADCDTVLRLISMHDIDTIVERAKDSTVVLKANVTFDTNKLAKDRKYRWNADNKIWWKAFKSKDIQKESEQAPFDVTVVDVPLESLWHS